MNKANIALLIISVIGIIISFILWYFVKIEFKTQAKLFIGFFYLFYWIFKNLLILIYNNLYYIIVFVLFIRRNEW